MTQWVLLLVMSSYSMTAGLHTTNIPAVATATFADRAACEAAGKTAVKLAEQARLNRPAVAFECMPTGTDTAKP